jgi:cell division septation protein DedD
MSSLFGETDDDVTLRTRRSEDRRGSELDDAPADREVTLNTGTVLALFFTLALICAVFFGFGYSMGRKSAQPAAVAASDGSPAPAAVSDTASSKPAPGSPAIQPIPGYMSQSEANAANEKAGAQSIKSSASTTPAPAAPVVQPRKPVVEAAPAPAPVVRTPPPAPAPVVAYNSAPTATPAAGATYVQIAAVSHQEDADVLLNALQRRGYKVLARSDAADRLIHVQIGPFSDRKQAEATRQKLLGDGYNAFLK